MSHRVVVVLPRAAVLALLAGCLCGSLLAQSSLEAIPAALTFFARPGGTAPSQTISVTATVGTASMNVSAESEGWLSVSPPLATTPSTLTVLVDSTGLAAGTYAGSVVITSTEVDNSPLVVAVTFTVTEESYLVATPNEVSVQYQLGRPAPAPVAVAIASTAFPVTFTAASSTSTGGAWLAVSPASATTPAGINAAIDPTGLAPGSYTGMILLMPPAPAAVVTVPVSLTVGAIPQLLVAPAALAFEFQLGGAVPGSQRFSISSIGSSLNHTVRASTSAGGNWLSLTPEGGLTPNEVRVTANPVGLAVGTYAGSIQIASEAAANSPVNIAVNLLVTSSSLLRASPAALSFTMPAGGPAPAAQTSTVTSSGTPLSFSASSDSAAGTNWLSVSPASGATPGPLRVSLASSALTLPAGTYSATIALASPTAGNSPLNIPVTLRVTATPALSAEPSSLLFSFQIGGANNPARSRTLLLNSPAPFRFTASVRIGTGDNWLFAGPISGTTPEIVAVSVNPFALEAGTYDASVVITAPGVANSPLTIPVILNVGASPLMHVSATSLEAAFHPGGPASRTFPLAVSSTGDALNYAATAAGGNWLRVTPLTGATPGNLTIDVSAAGLAPGVYSGAITLAATGANTQTVPVTVTVFPPGGLHVSATSLAFTQAQGGAPPPVQTVQVTTSASTSLSFTAAAAVVGGGSWLAVTPATGATPSSVSVSANAAGLAPGAYSGFVHIGSPGGASAAQRIAVTFTVTAAGP